MFDVFPSPLPPKSVKTALCLRQFIAWKSNSFVYPSLPHSTSLELSSANVKKAKAIWITQSNPAVASADPAVEKNGGEEAAEKRR